MDWCYNTFVPDEKIVSIRKGATLRMTSITGTRLLQLGKLATARGTLGPRHSRATPHQMEVARRIITDPTSYTTHLKRGVICIEDRLNADGQRMHAARLAGGALSVCLMHNLLYGGAHLSDNAAELRKLRHRLVFHNDCGALGIASMLIHERLTSPNAAGYTFLRHLGVEVPEAARERIAAWASGVPDDFIDADRTLAKADEVEDTVGEHNAVLVAVSKRNGEAFVAGPRLSDETDGLLAFAFTPWAAVRAGNALGVTRDEQKAAALLAQVFTAEALLELCNSDLQVAVR
jgi:hypothetical protein